MMKNFHVLFFVMVFSACTNPQNQDRNEKNQSTQPEGKIYSEYDKHVSIYQFNEQKSDSTLVCEKWYLHDSIVKKEGKFPFSIPFTGDYMDESLMKKTRESQKGIYETYDSLICETGGRSAWNRYEYIFGKHDWNETYKHYMAFWFEGLGEGPRPERPGYFLAETIKVRYDEGLIRQTTCDSEQNILEIIDRYYTVDHQLVMESWEIFSDYDGTLYKAFYTYN